MASKSHVCGTGELQPQHLCLKSSFPHSEILIEGSFWGVFHATVSSTDSPTGSKSDFTFILHVCRVEFVWLIQIYYMCIRQNGRSVYFYIGLLKNDYRFFKLKQKHSLSSMWPVVQTDCILCEANTLRPRTYELEGQQAGPDLLIHIDYILTTTRFEQILLKLVKHRCTEKDGHSFGGPKYNALKRLSCRKLLKN